MMPGKKFKNNCNLSFYRFLNIRIMFIKYFDLLTSTLCTNSAIACEKCHIIRGKSICQDIRDRNELSKSTEISK